MIKFKYYLLGSATCLIFYGFYFDFKILNPFYDTWINTHDLKGQYIGWLFFYNDDFKWPLTFFDTMLYPSGTNIVQTDGIPVLAILLKLFAKYFNTHFQFFGAWYLICFYLNFFFAFKILKKFSDENIYAFISACFFIAPSILLSRFIHPSLCAQWLILAAIYNLCSKKNILRDQLWKSLILVCALGIHFYIFVMVFILILIGEFKISRNYCITVLNLFITTCFSYFLYGYNLIKSTEAVNFLKYGVKISGFLDTRNRDIYFMDYNQFIVDFQEGTIYLGLGVVFLFAFNFLYIKNNFAFLYKASKLKKISIPIFILFLYSLGPQIKFNDLIFLDLNFVYDKLQPIPNTLRACGRFAWPFFYWILLCNCILFIRSPIIKPIKIALFLTILSIQFIDLSDYSLPANVTLSGNISLSFKNDKASLQTQLIHLYPPYIGDFEFNQPCHNMNQSRADYHTTAMHVAKMQSWEFFLMLEVLVLENCFLIKLVRLQIPFLQNELFFPPTGNEKAIKGISILKMVL